MSPTTVPFLLLLLPISSVLSSVKGVLTEDDPKLVQEYETDVRRVHRYGSVYGVLLQNAVRLQRFNSVNGTVETEDLGLILLDKEKSGGLLLEFKLISNSSALFCSTEGCRICTESATVSCIEIGVQKRKFYWISAEINNNKLYLTAVENNFKTSIHVFHLHENIYQIELKNKFFEPLQKQGRKVIGSFSTRGFVYFLGDIVLSGHPIANAKYKLEIVNKITRYCVDDESPDFGSRTDLVLSCDPGNYRTVNSFEFDRAENKLFVSFSRFYTQDNLADPFICQFDIEKVDQKLDETWHTFREIADHEKNKEKCSAEIKQGVDQVNDECFVESMDPFCPGTDTNAVKPGKSVCAVFRGQNTSNVCGNLINHKIFFGKKVFSATRPYHFKWLRRTVYPGMFLGTTSNQLFTKITLQGSKDGLQISRTSTITDAISTFYDPFLNGNTVLYVPTDVQHQLKSYQLLPRNQTETAILMTRNELDESCSDSILKSEKFYIGLTFFMVFIAAAICAACYKDACSGSRKQNYAVETMVILSAPEQRAHLLPVGSRPPSYAEKV